jgi:hypothetical protein
MNVISVCLACYYNNAYYLIGKFVNHKGRNRHFTNPEELEEQRRQELEKQQWRVSILRLITLHDYLLTRRLLSKL